MEDFLDFMEKLLDEEEDDNEEEDENDDRKQQSIRESAEPQQHPARPTSKASQRFTESMTSLSLGKAKKISTAKEINQSFGGSLPSGYKSSTLAASRGSPVDGWMDGWAG